MKRLSDFIHGWWITLTLPRKTKRYLAQPIDPSDFVDAPRPQEPAQENRGS